MVFEKLTYPQTKKDDVVDEYFGTQVSDPYRWLEEADDPEVLAWTAEQSDFAVEQLSRLPMRTAFKERLTELWNFPRSGPPQRRGDRLFFSKNDGLQNQPIFYVQEGDAEPRVLIDPNTFSEEGTTALMGATPSKDGKQVLYAMAPAGSDWREFRIRDVETGEDLPDLVDKVRWSNYIWRPDQTGFYYTATTDIESDDTDNQARIPQVRFHKIGTDQSEDEIIWEYPDYPSAFVWLQISDDEQHLIITVIRAPATATRVFLAPLDDHTSVAALLNEGDAEYYYFGDADGVFYFQTTNDAPLKRVIAVDVSDPTPEQWREVLPESEATLNGALLKGDYIVADYLENAHNVLKVYRTDGSFVRDVPLQGLGTVGMMSNHKKGSDFYFNYYSYLQPFAVMHYDVENDTLATFAEAATIPNFEVDQYETKQVFYESKDGTRVSMFITARKDLVLNGSNPTILYGYGGFNVSVTPTYYAWLPAWLEKGGVLAVANLRGGSEYGDAWHKAGMFENKQNVYDDFIAAAEWLIAEKYTAREHLAIEGRSNGGLLVAATILQRPDLCGAVLCHVPVIDMLRYQHFTAGRYWTSEYGDANDSEKDFSYLYEYSPLHNIEDGQAYPPILITTADHDDRVVPMHSKKFAATLQAANTDNNVILLRIDTDAGHGAGKATAKVIEERADVLAFAATLLGMSDDD